MKEKKYIQRNTPLQRHTGLARSAAPIIRKVAPKRHPNKAYQKVRKEFMEKSDGICKIQVPGICMGAATDIQHKGGRGSRILDKSGFLECCRACGEFVNTHPAYALANDFAVSRINKETDQAPEL